MPTRTIEISGFDELLTWLERAPEVVLPLAETAMEKTTQVVVGILATYPPATEANRPGRRGIRKVWGVPRIVPLGWYDRGVGWWQPVMNRQALTEYAEANQAARGGWKNLYGKSAGVLRMSKKKSKEYGGVAGYKLTKRSERLGTRWTSRVHRIGQTGVEGIIGDSASYAKYVNGPYQPPIFGLRGWKTIDQAMEEAEPDIKAAWDEALDGVAASFGSFVRR